MCWRFFHNPWEVYRCDLPDVITVAIPWTLTVLLHVGFVFTTCVPRVRTGVHTRDSNG